MHIRLLPYAIADGATNMANDDVLARSAAAGVASLRFYAWSAATVSLGYFQPHADVRAHSRLADLPWVRRPSGGATLVHHHELTYALALPSGSPWRSGEPWMLHMHRIIVTALAELGLDQKIVLVDDRPVKHGDVLCFQQFTVGDVLCAGRKIVGSAQRKYHQALMQHGSILLSQSEHTPELPGIRELTGVALSADQVRDSILRQFEKSTGWELKRSEWTTEAAACIRKMREERYLSVDWNERR